MAIRALKGVMTLLTTSSLLTSAVHGLRDGGSYHQGWEPRDQGPPTDLNTTICASPVVSKIFEDYDLSHDALGATVFALLYGYGLPSYMNEFRGPAGLQALGTNNIYNLGKPATPQSSPVVRSNVDTIYAISILDFAEQDLVLTLPGMEAGRYYVLAFYDPYGDNYASVGSRYESEAGQYLVRPSLATGKAGVGEDNCEGYQGAIDSPTLDGTLLIRVELKNNDTDLVVVNNFIDSVKLDRINNHTATMPPLVPADLQNLSISTPAQTLQLTARLASRNPPQNQELAKHIPSLLRYAGVEHDRYQTPPGVNLTQAGSIVDEIFLKFYTNPSNKDELNNGWSDLSSSYIGSYSNGTDVVARAFVADFGYLANTPDQSIYPSPPEMVYTLSADASLLITFVGGKPPLMSDGFWSLTIYDANGYLMANPQNVYALGDRSNLTYGDGSLVYGMDSINSSTTDSKPFQVLIQASDAQPPANWTGNWLPSPAGGGSFQLTLRFYAQEEALVNGTYVYPVVQNSTAILM